MKKYIKFSLLALVVFASLYGNLLRTTPASAAAGDFLPPTCGPDSLVPGTGYNPQCVKKKAWCDGMAQYGGVWAFNTCIPPDNAETLYPEAWPLLPTSKLAKTGDCSAMKYEYECILLGYDCIAYGGYFWTTNKCNTSPETTPGPTGVCTSIADCEAKRAACESGGGVWSQAGCSTAEGRDDPAYNCSGSAGNCDYNKFIVLAVNLASAAVGIIVVIMIILAGIQYAAAADDPGKITAAKNKIYNAIIALIAFLFMFAFLQWLVPGGIF